MTNPNEPPPKPPAQSRETTGAYRERQATDMNWIPWIVGAIALLLLIALIWWAMSDDETAEPVPDVTTPEGVYDDPVTPDADPAAPPVEE